MNNRKILLEKLIENMQVLSRHVGPGRENVLCSLDINRAQLSMLHTIYMHKQVTVNHLAETANTTPGAVTQIVDGLIAKGFLERQKDETDKRKVFVQFSTEGKEKYNRMKEKHMQFLQSLFEVLTDEELQKMVDIEQKLLDKLSVT